MFFWLSKIFWFLANPGTLLALALAAGTTLLWTRRRQGLGRAILAWATLASLLIAVVPVGEWMSGILENRFPAPAALPERVDGIVVLGGIVDVAMTEARGVESIGGAAGRLIAFARLARRYPEAKLVFSGGSGDPLRPEDREARVVGPLLETLGVAPDRLLFEDESRNTAENAALSRKMANPRPGETWVLVTSAFHMPRAVGCFRREGWPVLAFPTDYGTSGTTGGRLGFNLIGGFGRLNAALHEWAGLVFYRLSGRTDALFPAP
ncbi:MAG: YdcF family protein [Magnetospirillum sp. WYHS-4]